MSIKFSSWRMTRKQVHHSFTGPRKLEHRYILYPSKRGIVSVTSFNFNSGAYARIGFIWANFGSDFSSSATRPHLSISWIGVFMSINGFKLLGEEYWLLSRCVLVSNGIRLVPRVSFTAKISCRRSNSFARNSFSRRCKFISRLSNSNSRLYSQLSVIQFYPTISYFAELFLYVSSAFLDFS